MAARKTKTVADVIAAEVAAGKLHPVSPEAVKAQAKRAAKPKSVAQIANKMGDSVVLRVLDKKFTFGGEGTSRRASWDACLASKSVAEYRAKGGQQKYLPRWAKLGVVVY